MKPLSGDNNTEQKSNLEIINLCNPDLFSDVLKLLQILNTYIPAASVEAER